MPTVQEMLSESRKRDAIKKKMADKLRASKPGKKKPTAAATTEDRNSKTRTSESRKQETRRPVRGLRHRIESFWLVKGLNKHFPTVVKNTVTVAQQWVGDANFAKVEVKPAVVKTVLVSALTKAKAIEQKILSRPLVKFLSKRLGRIIRY